MFRMWEQSEKGCSFVMGFHMKYIVVGGAVLCSKECKTDFEGKLYLEMVTCFFPIAQEALKKCRYTFW